MKRLLDVVEGTFVAGQDATWGCVVECVAAIGDWTTHQAETRLWDAIAEDIVHVQFGDDCEWRISIDDNQREFCRREWP